MSIYFDNAATTQMRQEAFEALKNHCMAAYGNPSSVYGIAREAKTAVTEARQAVASVLNAKPDEIFFTGSGTEADNWAIKGVCEANLQKGKHIITTVIEHHAVLHTCEYLGKLGYDITYLPVDEYGLVKLSDLESAIRPDTVLISIMFANNEVGTIQPIAEIGAIAKKHGVTFHTDAVQAFGHVPIDVEAMNIDLLTLSAHKIYGPKGVGALYIRKGTKISTLIHGGGQERGRRAGTENVAGIAALGTCARLVKEEMADEAVRVSSLRDRIIKEITDKIPHVKLNGHPTNRLPGNVNVSFRFIEGESILLSLDMKGICASSGSACTSGSLDPSHVLLSLGLDHETAHGSLRITLGRYNTDEEVDKLMEVLPSIIERLRKMSPLYEEFLASQKR